jgi:hypothetical protein
MELALTRADPSVAVAPMAASVGDALAAAGEASWLVIEDEGRKPINIVAAERLRGASHRQSLQEIVAAAPPMIVVTATTTVRAVLASRAIDALTEDTDGILVLDGDEVAGVWPAADLTRALWTGGERLLGDTALPGRIDVPLIVKQCRFSFGGTDCLARCEFEEKPDDPSPCPDPRSLGAHDFVW